MYPRYQSTLTQAVEFSGVGVHSGKAATMRVAPAPANHGIVFVRSDVTQGDTKIPAQWNYVTDTRLCTKLTNKDGVSISTIEHVMSALAGLAIDNAILYVDGPEVPIMDGSAAVFIAAFQNVGTVSQSALRHYIRIKQSVELKEDRSSVAFTAADQCTFEFKFDFNGRVDLPAQHLKYNLNPHTFSQDVAAARTFGLLEDAEKLWAAGLALGASLENTVVIGPEGIMNPKGLRFDNEFVRHKVLDAIGDLYCAGAPILGAYQATCGGHRVNNLLLHKLFENKANWAYVTLPERPVPVILSGQVASQPAAAAVAFA